MIQKYIEKTKAVDQLARGYVYMMPAPVIIRVTQMLSLLEAVLLPH